MRLKNKLINNAWTIIFANVHQISSYLHSTGLKIDLMHFVVPDQVLMDVIQDAIDKLAALGSTVIFGQVDVFINGDFRRYRLKLEELSNAHLHQDHIQGADPFRVPVL